MSTFTLVIAALDASGPSAVEEIPSLLPALIYADKVCVAPLEADDLYEVSDFMDVCHRFDDILDFVGLDSWYMPPGWDDRETPSVDWLEYERLAEAGELEIFDRDNPLMLKAHFAAYVDLLQQLKGQPLIEDPKGVLAELAVSLPMTQTRARKSRAQSLSVSSIRALPSFDTISLDQVRDIRSRLSPFLVAYRRSMLAYAALIDADPWQYQDLQEQTEDVVSDEIEPALVELQQQIRSDRYLRELCGEFFSDFNGTSASFMTFGVASVVHMPMLAAVGLASGSKLASTVAKHRQNDATARKHGLYFLHELSKKQ